MQSYPIKPILKFPDFISLRNCVQSAASVVSSASTTLGVEQPDHFSSADGSEFGGFFPSEPGETLLRCISPNTIYEFEEECYALLRVNAPLGG